MVISNGMKIGIAAGAAGATGLVLGAVIGAEYASAVNGEHITTRVKNFKTEAPKVFEFEKNSIKSIFVKDILKNMSDEEIIKMIDSATNSVNKGEVNDDVKTVVKIADQLVISGEFPVDDNAKQALENAKKAVSEGKVNNELIMLINAVGQYAKNKIATNKNEQVVQNNQEAQKPIITPEIANARHAYNNPNLIVNEPVATLDQQTMNSLLTFNNMIVGEGV